MYGPDRIEYTIEELRNGKVKLYRRNGRHSISHIGSYETVEVAEKMLKYDVKRRKGEEICFTLFYNEDGEPI